jgi:ABC-type sugar transport system ATPase subunit
MECLLEMRGITKRFTGVLALDNVDFDLRTGEVTFYWGKMARGNLL